jgi:putative membrane protein
MTPARNHGGDLAAPPAQHGGGRRLREAPLNAARGFLIGMAELVPGVSGGTVALVTGIYDRLIDSASHVLSAGRHAVLGPDRRSGARAHLRRTDWSVILPVLVGMVVAVVTMAGVMHSFVTGAPEHARGLFLGLVAASILVPLRMLPQREGAGVTWADGAMFLLAAVTAFVLVGLAGGGEIADPPLVLVTAAAAVAICALVVPGVSGSFFLLAVGLYATTLDAVDSFDLLYIAAFGLGAALGLGSFVKVLHWALNHHRRVTLLAMAGLMLGSLRALWPWQGESEHGVGEAVLPYDPVLGPVSLAVLGVVVVLTLVRVESRAAARSSASA